MPLSIFDFRAIRLRLASPEDILSWSHGEVTKPETINYRTQKPEREGLFDERIFGPVKDWECACGKYKRIRYRGVVCDKCNVEVTRAVVRRERMGHINLVAPVAHIWFLRGVPSNLSLILDLSVQNLERVTYFADFIVTDVNEDLKREVIKEIEGEERGKTNQLKSELQDAQTSIRAKWQRSHPTPTPQDEATLQRELEAIARTYEEKMLRLKEASVQARRELGELTALKILSKQEYQDLSLKYGQVFEAGIGAEAILALLERVNLTELISSLEAELKEAPPNRSVKLNKRLKLVKLLKSNNIKPTWMIMSTLPVIPPDLRPMVPLDGGRYASSDVNDLYRRVINRNNRLRRLLELNAPEVIIRNEKRMLQEAVDALIDNSARRSKATAATTGQRRQLRSLADTLRGKQGRFRQNLLGKRVDYSGRSVIVVGPTLKLHQCGLPKVMALELFKPFVISRLIGDGLVHNVRSASRLIESGPKEVWDILESVTANAHVLLNRAPTLHRLSIQAFQPVLIEGKAIQLHPMVCPPFNADFDGDQMAVHVPLTEEAKWEAAEIMRATKNILKPATGDPVTLPNQDIIWGIAYLTTYLLGDEKKEREKLRIFADPEELLLAVARGAIHLRARVLVRVEGKIIETSAGRILVARVIPAGLRDYQRSYDKKAMRDLIRECVSRYGSNRTVTLLDDLKSLAFRELTRVGMSWGMEELPDLPMKVPLLKEAEVQVRLLQDQYEEGLLTLKEKHAKVVEIWTGVKDKVTAAVKEAIDRDSAVYSMISSQARGSWGQVSQMMGMKGLVVNPQGETIELPVLSSFKEGFDVLEYFISTHGARKGLSDTALRTANAGYLTRRLVDVAQGVIIYEETCSDTKGYVLTQLESNEMGTTLGARALGRVAATDLKDSKTKEVIVKKGKYIDVAAAAAINAADLEEIRLFSILTCAALRGVCGRCYGWDLGYNQPVKIGTAVGIIAAQSIGEPGTQLTMRTFHTGGVVGQDITQGLPRVEELFENRPPKQRAILAEISGRIKIEAMAAGVRKLLITTPRGDAREYLVPAHTSILVKEGQDVERGVELTDGHYDLGQLYHLRGREAVERYILHEIQFIYTTQGQALNDKHVELMVRQMFSRVLVKNSGDTNFLPGEVVAHTLVVDANEKVAETKGAPAEFEELLLGISRVSLSTESFLSAASFQETARVLINAAITGRIDRLTGLKENVIIGRLIPAGTGFRKPGEIEPPPLIPVRETIPEAVPAQVEVNV